MLLEVRDGARDAVRERGPGREPELLAGPRDVQATPRLSVGLAGVPDEAPLEGGRPRDDPGQVADRDLLAAAQVHRVAGVILLGGEDDALRRVLDVEKLARGRAVT